MARRVDEGDLAALAHDGIGADMLGDAAGFARRHVAVTEGIQQGGLAVVHVAHDGDHRGPGLELILPILLLGVVRQHVLIGLGDLLLQGDVVVAGDELAGIEVNVLVDGGHDAQQEQLLDDLGGGLADLLGQLLHRDHFRGDHRVIDDHRGGLDRLLLVALALAAAAHGAVLVPHHGGTVFLLHGFLILSLLVLVVIVVVPVPVLIPGPGAGVDDDGAAAALSSLGPLGPGTGVVPARPISRGGGPTVRRTAILAGGPRTVVPMGTVLPGHVGRLLRRGRGPLDGGRGLLDRGCGGLRLGGRLLHGLRYGSLRGRGFRLGGGLRRGFGRGLGRGLADLVRLVRHIGVALAGLQEPLEPLGLLPLRLLPLLPLLLLDEPVLRSLGRRKQRRQRLPIGLDPIQQCLCAALDALRRVKEIRCHTFNPLLPFRMPPHHVSYSQTVYPSPP